MGRFILVPVGEHAKQHCADGLPLWATDKPVLLGRGVRPSDGYKYPNEWNSLSTRHCQLSFATEAQVRLSRVLWCIAVLLCVMLWLWCCAIHAVLREVGCCRLLVVHKAQLSAFMIN